MDFVNQESHSYLRTTNTHNTVREDNPVVFSHVWLRMQVTLLTPYWSGHKTRLCIPSPPACWWDVWLCLWRTHTIVRTKQSAPLSSVSVIHWHNRVRTNHRDAYQYHHQGFQDKFKENKEVILYKKTLCITLATRVQLYLHGMLMVHAQKNAVYYSTPWIKSFKLIISNFCSKSCSSGCELILSEAKHALWISNLDS